MLEEGAIDETMKLGEREKEEHRIARVQIQACKKSKE
jgi:hypothetical protein